MFFLECFFSHMSLFILDSCADHFHLPDHQFTRFKSRSKMFCAWFFGRRNICGKLPSFVNSIVTSDVIAGIGADSVWVHTRTISIISWSIKTLLDAADVDGGLRTATGTSKCIPFTHSPYRFQSFKLIFGFKKSKSLRIRPLLFQLHFAAPLAGPMNYGCECSKTN